MSRFGAALAGAGMTLLPDFLCRQDLLSGALQHMLPVWPPPPALMHAVSASRRCMVPAVRWFLDYLGAGATAGSLDDPR